MWVLIYDTHPILDGRTALDVACDEGKWDNVRIIAGLGANIHSPLKGMDRSSKACHKSHHILDGVTVLEVATCSSQWDGVRILAELGADLNILFKSTPL